MLLRTQTRLLRFGVFEFDPASGDLWKGGRRLKLQNQPRQVLKLLVSRPGELVTREDLQRQLWPGDTFVDFNNGLNVAIRKIREALGDVTPSPRCVETERALGYRFIAPVSQEFAQPDQQNAGASPTIARRSVVDEPSAPSNLELKELLPQRAATRGGPEPAGSAGRSTSLRSSGVGWRLGVGRAGAIVGPVIGGELMRLHWPTNQIFLVAAMPAVISTAAMFSMRWAISRDLRTDSSAGNS